MPTELPTDPCAETPAERPTDAAVFIGVRHQSPACARLVARAIEALRPAYVLVLVRPPRGRPLRRQRGARARRGRYPRILPPAEESDRTVVLSLDPLVNCQSGKWT